MTDFYLSVLQDMGVGAGRQEEAAGATAAVVMGAAEVILNQPISQRFIKIEFLQKAADKLSK